MLFPTSKFSSPAASKSSFWSASGNFRTPPLPPPPKKKEGKSGFRSGKSCNNQNKEVFGIRWYSESYGAIFSRIRRCRLGNLISKLYCNFGKRESRSDFDNDQCQAKCLSTKVCLGHGEQKFPTSYMYRADRTPCQGKQSNPRWTTATDSTNS